MHIAKINLFNFRWLETKLRAESLKIRLGNYLVVHDECLQRFATTSIFFGNAVSLTDEQQSDLKYARSKWNTPKVC